MNKLLAIALFLLVELTASAQGWEKTHHPADPLYGVDAYNSYKYHVPGVGSFITWEWDNPSIRLVTDRGSFRDEALGWLPSYRAVFVNVGVYRMSTGQLIEKFQLDMFFEDNQGHSRIYANKRSSNRKNLKAIMKVQKALRTEDTCVRFVCKLYEQGDFDLVVKCCTW